MCRPLSAFVVNRSGKTRRETDTSDLISCWGSSFLFFCRRHTHTHIRSSHATWFVFELRYILGNKQQQLAYLMLESGAEIDWSITRKRINSLCVCVCVGLVCSRVVSFSDDFSPNQIVDFNWRKRLVCCPGIHFLSRRNWFQYCKY